MYTCFLCIIKRCVSHVSGLALHPVFGIELAIVSSVSMVIIGRKCM
jgi:hypothetical protein